VAGTLVITVSGQTVTPTTYTVTVNGSHATTKGEGEYAEGETVTINAGSRNGYSFNGWTVTSGGVTLANANSATTTFTMPAGNVTVTANWKSTGVDGGVDGGGGGGGGATNYLVTFETNGGSVVSSQRVNSGAKATKPTDPTREGFAFAGWYSDTTLTTAYDFNAAVTRNITLYAKWTATITPSPDPWKNPFMDVNPSDWFYGDVEYAVTNGLFNGTSVATFAPNEPMTRAMLVTVLYRMQSAVPAIAYNNPFTDVPDSEWYADAVKWAAGNGIVNGIGNGLFAPGVEITREQMATILYRYAQFAGIDVSVGENTNILSFADAFDISEYAVPAFQWTCGAGIINGKLDGHLDPQGTATRAEAAAMLHRFMESVK
jgi:uncharacterized repeat protein (TIGR02543 family)